MRSRRLMVVLIVLGVVLPLGLVAIARALGPSSSQAQPGSIHDCPLQGKWAVSVWSGADGADAEQAFATCGAGTMAVAYSIDPNTQKWSRWFAGRPGISNLTTLDQMQGIITLGGEAAPAASSP